MENKSHALAAGLFVLAVSATVGALGLWIPRASGSYKAYENVSFTPLPLLTTPPV